MLAGSHRNAWPDETGTGGRTNRNTHPTWKGLNTLGVAIGYRRDSKGNESLEYRYYISSATLTEEQFATAVRGHWGIESVPQAHKFAA